VIPDWARRELSAGELNAVLLHELAHLRRWDDWTNLAQKVLSALLFFHPVVWWIDNRLTLEREMACDDYVLDGTTDPRAYAECLVALAERGLLRRGLALAQGAVGRMRHTSLRVLQILDKSHPRATTIWRPALCIAATVAAGSLLTFSGVPSLVAFNATPAAETLTASASRSMPAVPLPAYLSVAHDSVQPLPVKADASGTATLKPIPVAASLGDLTPRVVPALAKRSPRRNMDISKRAKRSQDPSNSLKLLRISTTMLRDFPVSNGFLVVMRDEQYIVSDHGSCRISMIRVTVYHPENSRAVRENPAKST